VWLEGLGQLKNPVTSFGMEAAINKIDKNKSINIALFKKIEVAEIRYF
jgi:hypothetical protein